MCFRMVGWIRVGEQYIYRTSIFFDELQTSHRFSTLPIIRIYFAILPAIQARILIWEYGLIHNINQKLKQFLSYIHLNLAQYTSLIYSILCLLQLQNSPEINRSQNKVCMIFVWLVQKVLVRNSATNDCLDDEWLNLYKNDGEGVQNEIKR